MADKVTEDQLLDSLLEDTRSLSKDDYNSSENEEEIIYPKSLDGDTDTGTLDASDSKDDETDDIIDDDNESDTDKPSDDDQIDDTETDTAKSDNKTVEVDGEALDMNALFEELGLHKTYANWEEALRSIPDRNKLLGQFQSQNENGQASNNTNKPNLNRRVSDQRRDAPNETEHKVAANLEELLYEDPSGFVSEIVRLISGAIQPKVDKIEHSAQLEQHKENIQAATIAVASRYKDYPAHVDDMKRILDSSPYLQEQLFKNSEETVETLYGRANTARTKRLGAKGSRPRKVLDSKKNKAKTGGAKSSRSTSSSSTSISSMTPEERNRYAREVLLPETVETMR